MAIVSFTLSDESVVAFQNVLACILRFSEDVSLDAKRGALVLSALNLTKTAFVSFTFSASHFARYRYEGSTRFADRFYCVLYIRALLSIFRSRTCGEASKGVNAESSIEKCDISIDDGPGKKSRFVAKIAWRNGITATHAIPFEEKAPIHAVFDMSKASNHWSVSAHTLRRLMEHFGPKVELLDINTEGNKVVNLTCFTEKQYVKTDGLLNMNLHTSIAVKMDEFDFIDVEDKHHIIINVKDFRAILQHACTTSGSLSAYYSEPWCPLKFSYEENGMQCEFILVTSGNRANNEPPKKQKTRTRQGTARPVLASGATNATLAKNNEQPSQPVQVASQMNETVFPASEQPPTARTGVETWPDFDMRPPPVPPSLMRTETRAEDDSQWEPVNPEDEQPDFVQIEWDESLQPELSFVPISTGQESRDSMQTPLPEDTTQGLEPTQRLTQVRKFGLFD